MLLLLYDRILEPSHILDQNVIPRNDNFLLFLLLLFEETTPHSTFLFPTFTALPICATLCLFFSEVFQGILIRYQSLLLVIFGLILVGMEAAFIPGRFVVFVFRHSLLLLLIIVVVHGLNG